jgi:hypothetical protein
MIGEARMEFAPRPGGGGVMTKRRDRTGSDGAEASEGSPAEYRLLEYDIVDEPMEEAEGQIPEELGKEAEELHEALFDDPASVVGRLEELVRRYPESAGLGNWLTVAYQGARMDAKADALIEAEYRKRPGYLFARVNYARLLIRRGELDQVPGVFEGGFDLKLMYPERTRFHVSELAALGSVAGEYFCLTGQEEVALRYLDLLEEVVPDHPGTEHLEMLLLPWVIAQTAEALRGKRRRKPGGAKGGRRRKRK